MSSVEQNAMTRPGPPDADTEAVMTAVRHPALVELHRIHVADRVHGFHETDKLMQHHISAWKCVLGAREEVSYGTNFFGKVSLGDDLYVHVRAHKSHQNKIDFYALHQTRDSALWTLDDPLVYFNY